MPKSSKKKKAVKSSGATKPKPKTLKKTKPSKPTKTIVSRIKEVVTPVTNADLIERAKPVEPKEVHNFGQMSFDAQARLILETFPVTGVDVIGTTEKSGAGTTGIPAIAKS